MKRNTFRSRQTLQTSHAFSPLVRLASSALRHPDCWTTPIDFRCTKNLTMRLSRCAQLVSLLTSFTDAQSMCSASMSPSISVCQDNACNSAAVELGDTVTFEVCVENLSFEIPGSAETTAVSAVLQAATEIEIFLACTTGLRLTAHMSTCVSLTT